MDRFELEALHLRVGFQRFDLTPRAAENVRHVADIELIGVRRVVGRAGGRRRHQRVFGNLLAHAGKVARDLGE